MPKILFLVLLTGLFVSGCKTPDKARRVKLTGKEPAELLEGQRLANPYFQWLSAKVSTEVETSNKSVSFKINMRMRKDSLIWISMSSYGIEAVRAMISTDSVFVINRVNKTLLETDFDYLSEMANTDIDFGTLQALITGSALEEFNPEDFQVFNDKDGYLLSRMKKRKLKRVRNIFERIEKLDKKDIPDKEVKEDRRIERIERIADVTDSSEFVAQSLWLRPEDNRIIRYMFRDFNPDRLLEVNYSEFKQVSEQIFPHKMNIRATGNEPVNMEMEFSNITLNEPVSFPFSVPASFERLKLE